MRINKITLEGVGVFDKETIDFRPCPEKRIAEMHIFTGTNGSGKSTILKAMAAAFENTGLNADNVQVCNNDTNQISKYLRKQGNESKFELQFEVSGKTDSILYTGCPKGAKHVHLIANTNKYVNIYRQSLVEINSSTVFDYALFAYSGNRFVNLSTPIKSPNESNQNPLFQSLEFNKQYNPAYSIDKWISTSLLKRSYAQTEGLKQKSSNYNDTIQKIEKALGDIIGFDIKFKLDQSLDYPVIVYNSKEHQLDVLPDGLKSIISWIADLCMRLEKMKWESDIAVFDRNIVLFLDEIEIHLHIEWQRKILPVVQKLFPNAQIFISTHSPFIVNSIDNAWIYSLEVDGSNAKVRSVELSQDGKSVQNVLRTIFGVNETFGLAIEEELKKFYELRNEILANKMLSKKEEDNFKKLSLGIAEQSEELETIIGMELRQIKRQTQKDFVL